MSIELIAGIITTAIIGVGFFVKYFKAITVFFSPNLKCSDLYLHKDIYEQKIVELEKNQDRCIEDRKLLNDAVRILRTAGELMHQTVKSHEGSLRAGTIRFDKNEEKCDKKADAIEVKLNECAEKIAKIEGRLSNE